MEEFHLQDENSADIAVVGGGLAGLAAAAALGSEAASVLLIAPPRPADQRTTALLGPSIDALRRIGAWRRVASATPLRAIRIIDATGRLFRAPEVCFRSEDLDLEAFGYNVPNEDLLRALEEAASGHGVSHLPAAAEGLHSRPEHAEVRTVSGAVQARLVVAADGRASAMREAAGIPTRTKRYDQTALVTTLRHAWPHEDISTEFHTRSGPFTFVPLPGNSSSLVWVLDPGEAARLAALPPDELAREIETRSQAFLGAVTVEGPVQTFPLNSLAADRCAAHRLALVGEAAHVLPPIGAQGFNLALRDVAALAELVAENSADPGSAAVTETYDRRRRADMATRIAAIDALNRTLLTDFLPAQAARSIGLYMLGSIPPLRRFLMRQGLAGG